MIQNKNKKKRNLSGSFAIKNHKEKQSLLGRHNLSVETLENRLSFIAGLVKMILKVDIVQISQLLSDNKSMKVIEEGKAFEFPIKNSYCSEVIKKREQIIIPDIAKDKTALKKHYVEKLKVRYFLGLPLLDMNGNIVGILSALNKEPKNINDEEMSILKGFASWAQYEINSYIISEIFKRLQFNEMKLKAIYENVVDGLITIREDGVIESFNSAAEKIFSYKRKEVLGKNVIMLMPEPYKSEHDSYISRYLKTGQAKIIGFSREVTGLKKNGIQFPLALGVSEFMIGQKRYFVGIMRDLSIQKEMEKEIRINRKSLISIIENMLGGLITMDQEGRVISMNPSSEKITGFRKEELIGKDLSLLVPEHLQNSDSHFLPNAHRASIGKVTEWEMRRKTGEIIPIELSLFKITTLYGKGFAGNIRDITEKREIERLRREYVSSISHELRTPITSIKGTLGLIKGGICGKLPDKAMEMIDIASKNSERLLRIINDLLDMEKIDAGKMDINLNSVDITKCIAQSLESIKVFGYNNSLNFNFINPNPAIRVYADSERLIQVLVNLLSNAAKFSPPGDTIEISMKRSEGRVHVSITDHGPGITEEFKNRIFKMFSQSDSSDMRSKGGTGLGLSISKGLIEKMGGAIKFNSIPGAATTFSIEIPEYLDNKISS